MNTKNKSESQEKMSVNEWYRLSKPLIKIYPEEHAKVLVFIAAGMDDKAIKIMSSAVNQWFNGRDVEFDRNRSIGLF